jgi:hypothetical protein
VDLEIPVFLISGLVGGEWSSSRPGLYVTRKISPHTNLIQCWLGHRTCPDGLRSRKFLTLSVLELHLLGHPALSQSIYRLRYGPHNLPICAATDKLYPEARVTKGMTASTLIWNRKVCRSFPFPQIPNVLCRVISLFQVSHNVSNNLIKTLCTGNWNSYPIPQFERVNLKCSCTQIGRWRGREVVPQLTGCLHLHTTEEAEWEEKAPNCGK